MIEQNLKDLHSTKNKLEGELTAVNNAIKALESANTPIVFNYPITGQWRDKILFCLTSEGQKPRDVAKRMKEAGDRATLEKLLLITSQYLPVINQKFNSPITRQKMQNRFLYKLKK